MFRKPHPLQILTPPKIPINDIIYKDNSQGAPGNKSSLMRKPWYLLSLPCTMSLSADGYCEQDLLKQWTYSVLPLILATGRKHLKKDNIKNWWHHKQLFHSTPCTRACLEYVTSDISWAENRDYGLRHYLFFTESAAVGWQFLNWFSSLVPRAIFITCTQRISL